ncbi:MAG: bifunctional diaminohydroxyphosphoribosylaminopyrimidine deaminase/5-amino-6-(5-phosphoribosylamino)uracil reductase RibD [Ktedonobacteraceae bacterium]
MQLAINSARSVEGRTSPRPAVGAVVVRDGEVVGTGATSPPYGPHAEIHALKEAGEAARGADLYVTLEPCCVTIHTPPCTDAIIAADVRRVVIGTLDPNPRVHQKGVEQLRTAGIEVVTDVLRAECNDLVRPFATFVRKKRPYVTAKWAMTLDGKIATRTGDAYWISGTASRTWVHNLRDRVDAILIGSGTAHADNPQLTVRLSQERKEYKRPTRMGPLRVVLATNGQIEPQLRLLQPELAIGTCIIVGESCPQQQCRKLEAYGVEVLQVANDPDGRVDILVALEALAYKGNMHVLLEGGAKLLGTAFDRSLIDRVAVFIAPKLIGGSQALVPLQGYGIARMQEAIQLQHVQTCTLDNDILIEGEIAQGINLDDQVPE